MSLEAYVQIAAIFVAFISVLIFLRGSLRDIRTDLKDGLEAVHTKIEAVRTELKEDIREVRSEVQGVRTELKEDIREVRSEVQAVDTKIEAVRTELKEDIQGVRTKVDGVQQQVAGQGERLARIEGMLTPQNGRFSAQEETVSAEPNPSPQPRAARPAAARPV